MDLEIPADEEATQEFGDFQFQTSRLRQSKKPQSFLGQNKPLLDFGLIAAESRRLSFSSSPIPTAALVFNSALRDPEKIDVDHPDFRRLLQLASIIVRRFSEKHERDLRILISMIQWVPPPHIGQVALLHALLADPTTNLDFPDLVTISRRFPILFRSYVSSRIWSNPLALCPRPQAAPSYQLAKLSFLKNCGCPDEFLREILQCSYLQSLNFFREAATQQELLPAFASFLFNSPKYFSVLFSLYPNSAELTIFIRNLIHQDQDLFCSSFFGVLTTLPESIIGLVVKVLQKDQAPLRRYLETVDASRISTIFPFLVTWNFPSCVSYINHTWTGELFIVASNFYRENPSAFLKFLIKCDDSRLPDIIFGEVHEHQLFEVSDEIIQVVLSKPRLYHDVFDRDPQCFINLLIHKRHFATDVANLVRTNRELFTPDLRETFFELSPEVSPLCFPDDERDQCFRELMRRVIDHPPTPFPSISFFQQLQNALQQNDLVRTFSGHLSRFVSNEQWIPPISRFPKLFSSMIATIDRSLADLPEHLPFRYEVRQFLQKLISFHLNSSTCPIRNDFNEFCRFAELIITGHGIQLTNLSISSQSTLFGIFLQHCPRANQPQERIVFFNLLKEFAETAIFDSIDDQARDLIFRSLIINVISRRSIEQIDSGFKYLTWFLFEFSKDPFSHQALGPRIKQTFLEYSAMNSDEVQEILTEKPIIRSKWLKAVWMMTRDEQLIPFFGHPVFAGLLTNVIALALGSPSVYDFTGDVPLLELFLKLLESVETVVITKGFLKVVTTKMKARIEKVSDLFQAIFAQLCTPKYLRSLSEALIEDSPGRR